MGDESQLNNVLEKHNLKLIGQLAKGWSSFIYLAQDKRGKKIVLKVLREKSNRKNMAQRESENLKIANSVKVGPELIGVDLQENAVLMEYIEGIAFSEWLYKTPNKNELEKFISELYVQAKLLDGIGLDHGQLAGRGRNILVKNDLPVIVDFEKASTKRKVHNVKVLDSMLFKSKGSIVVKKVKGILG